MPLFKIFSKSKKQPKKEKQKKIVIDHREKSSLVPSNLSSLNFTIEYKQLPVADYLLNNIAIERKTISDLKSSITNKRIFSQLLELKQYPIAFLIIEGPESELYNSEQIHENAVRGFLLSLAIEYKIQYLRSKNPKETAKLLSILAKKQSNKDISLRPSKIYKSPSEQKQHILEGFPNIGPKKAKSLLETFGSLKNIFNATPKELEKVLGKKAPEFFSLLTAL